MVGRRSLGKASKEVKHLLAVWQKKIAGQLFRGTRRHCIRTHSTTTTFWVSVGLVWAEGSHPEALMFVAYQPHCIYFTDTKKLLNIKQTKYIRSQADKLLRHSSTWGWYSVRGKSTSLHCHRRPSNNNMERRISNLMLSLIRTRMTVTSWIKTSKNTPDRKSRP